MLVPRQEYSRELKIACMRELDSHNHNWNHTAFAFYHSFSSNIKFVP